MWQEKAKTQCVRSKPLEEERTKGKFSKRRESQQGRAGKTRSGEEGKEIRIKPDGQDEDHAQFSSYQKVDVLLLALRHPALARL